MNNFLDFIVKDINAKKTLLSTLPTKTKTNKKKFNANIKDMENIIQINRFTKSNL